MQRWHQYSKTFLTILLFLFLSACTASPPSSINQENYDKIQTDMTLQQVTQILGPPSSTQSLTIAGVSGTAATWKDKEAEINIQFFNNKVAIKSFNQDETQPDNN